MRSIARSLLLATLVVTCPSAANATVIEFEATNVSGDIWRYDYFLSDVILSAQQGFVVFFAEDLYADLEPSLPSPLGWDVLSTNPDTVLHSDGTYDALALVDSPSFTGPFSVSFSWLGPAGTAPRSQPFEVYDLDESGMPISFEFGDTIPRSTTAVPEPSTLMLLAAGAVLGLRHRMRRPATRSV
jgi:hypothetical protein